MSFPDLNIVTKQKLHDSEITAIDYSTNKQILLTTAEDLKLKVWKFSISQKKVSKIHIVKYV